MQRMAIAAGVLGLVLSGCAAEQINRPDPHMTRTPTPSRASRTPRRYVHRPLPPLPAPLPRSHASTTPATSGARPWWWPAVGVQPGHWRAIVVHHSAGTTDTPATMDRFHRRVRGWPNGLGYHFVIGNGVNTEDGKVYVGPRWQRQILGAHCHNTAGSYFGTWRPDNYFNTNAIGICLIGNFENAAPTPRQMRALEQLTQSLCHNLGISASHIYGHGGITHRTACPGRYLAPQIATVRRAAAQQTSATPATDVITAVSTGH